jgi:hypothetical protein
MNHTDARFYLAASRELPVLEPGWGDTVLSDEELRALATHVDACDRCIEELRVASRRLTLATEMAVEVPAAVAARAAIAAGMPSKVAAKTSVAGGWFAELRERLAAAVTMPVLVPVALAALALIVIVPRLQNPTVRDGELSRAVELRQPARVTVDSAAVRKEPAGDAVVVTTLVRGDRTVLVAQQGDWYRVALADGGEGWIERRAFE